MPPVQRLLQRVLQADWRAWLVRLEQLPSWQLFLAALLFGLLLSLPWQCARLLGDKKSPATAETTETAMETAAQAPDRRSAGRAQSILGMPAPSVAPAPELPAPADPSAQAAASESADGAEVQAAPETTSAADASAAVAVHSPAPQYPTAALRFREEGTVMVRVDIDSSGLPLRVDVEKSSRSRALDRAAVEAVGQWRFKPAMAQGQAVESSLVVPISFKANADGQ